MEDVEDFIITYEYTRGQMQSRIHRGLNRLVWKYHDMGYVADEADESLIAPAFVKKPKSSDMTREEYEELAKGYHEYSLESLRKAAIVDKKIQKHVDSMEAFFEEVRKIYPDFCQSMEENVSKDDYSHYMKYREKLRKVATETLPGAIYTSPQEAVLEQEDKISGVIDSQGFTRACKVEDEFVLSELDAYLAKVTELSPEERKKIDSRIIETENGEGLSVTQFAERMKHKREERIALSDEFLQLYEKKKLIKFELNPVELNEIGNSDVSFNGNKPTTPTAPEAPGGDGDR